ncbi:transcriptional regulator [Aliidongia dinghuensis]|uniref:Transcriptional regulator n=1 Tax=Aliidongia dinghuensis TaxID=1867774 RepID=A0A8J2YYW5_9PROT|nr:helix-turn-helix transcriptional regulator [Aliidongia dinghuensis]GGF38224.1 transcriptional regulator [Aliidongia dinghuensis]
MDRTAAAAIVAGMSYARASLSAARPVGDHIREWRQRRRLSQLDLACEADISTRHLSFLETGRARPSREMVLHLAERLDIPLRERNLLLVAAGFAPIFAERALDDPALAAARRAVDLVLAGHEPYPALAVDRHWTLVAANAAVGRLLAGVDPAQLAPPLNVLRLSLHPAGLAPRILNLREWRDHLLDRLRRQVELTADPVLVALMDELKAYPVPPAPGPRPANDQDQPGVVVPFRLETAAGPLDLFSTTTIFGTPIDVTLSELAIEAFYPADAASAERLRLLAHSSLPGPSQQG